MNNSRFENTKIVIYGNKAQIEEARKKLNRIKNMLTGNEANDRLLLQNGIIDDIKADILYDGNGVYSKTKLLKQFETLLKHGMHKLTNDLYEFFHLCCGSIAHYDKQGWISEYPDLFALKEFFKRNEYGQSALANQPNWATDRIAIVKEMEKLLNLSVDRIDSEKDKDTEHKLDVLEEVVKRGRKDKNLARELLDKIFS